MNLCTLYLTFAVVELRGMHYEPLQQRV